MTPDEEAEFRRRQKSRNLIVGAILIGMCALFYAITIVRLGQGG